MKPAEKIYRLLRNIAVKTGSAADDAVFQNLKTAYIEMRETNSVEQEPEMWRFVMKSPLTRLAIAAAVVIACGIGLFLWRTTGSGITLADVLTHIQQFNAYKYQRTITVTGLKVGDRTVDHVTHSTILVSRDGNLKETMSTEDPNGARKNAQEVYLLPEKKIMLQLMPDAKRYAEVEVDDEARLQDDQKQRNDPRVMIQQLLDTDYVNLGRSMIDGLEVEGFQTTGPRQMGAVTAQAVITIWVDMKTQLPVRSEMDIRNGQMRLYSLDDRFQWDVPIDPREFEPVIPPDYTPMTDTPVKYPPRTEETLIKGLRRFAEMTGQYPDELNALAISMKLNELCVQEFAGDVKGTSKEEILTSVMANKEALKKWLDKTICVAAAATFYDTLVQGNKDAYYGKTLTPKDTDKVLLRWKLSDTEYRVIFGDLHAETVSPEKLAEFEKTQPK